MAVQLPPWRYVKIAAPLFALYVVYSFISLSGHQWRFQKYLAAQYITWDDFPRSYADTLRAKHWAELETFDYEHVFPPPDLNGTNSIPPSIHFIWFANLYKTHTEINEIPSRGSKAPQICEQRNPNLTVKIWSAEEARALMEDHYSWFLPTYDAYRYPIQRVDAFKYFLLWHHGGIYMDMDIECRRSLEPLLPFPAWFPEASPLGVNNDLMATRARHPVIKLMIDNLAARNKNFIFPYLTIFWSTGPQFTGDLLKRWFLKHGPTYVEGTSKVDADVDEWFVLPQVFYSEEFTFFGHTPGGTWHEGDVAAVLWFVAHPIVFWGLVLIFVGGLAALIYRRWRRRRRSRAVKDIEL